MLENCKNARERWGGVHQLIDRWLAERQTLLVHYSALANDAGLAGHSEARAAQVQRFCQLLMDYVSAGHFEVYNQLADEARAFGDGSERLLEALLPELNRSLDTALDFNDTYDSSAHCATAWKDLPHKLSVLGEALAGRFNLEDRLIVHLHAAHQERIAANQG